MFVPGDNFYAAAPERDPALFEDAAAQGVVIVTPATLIALAKAVAFGWRQEKVAENAQRVHELGRELYRRLAKMAEHIARCGDALGRSVQHYNQLVGSLEHSVMPQARRFNELEVEGTAAELPLLEQIELQTRALRAERRRWTRRRRRPDWGAARNPPVQEAKGWTRTSDHVGRGRARVWNKIRTLSADRASADSVY